VGPTDMDEQQRGKAVGRSKKSKLVARGIPRLRDNVQRGKEMPMGGGEGEQKIRRQGAVTYTTRAWSLEQCVRESERLGRIGFERSPYHDKDTPLQLCTVWGGTGGFEDVLSTHYSSPRVGGKLPKKSLC